MTNVVALETSTLQRRAERIRKLLKDMVHNSLAVGHELSEAREDRSAFPIGPHNRILGWKEWLRAEFDIGERHAQFLIHVYNKFGHLGSDGSDLPTFKVLRVLLPPGIPESARKEVIERTRKGERFGAGKAKKIVQKHLPSPKKANQMAQETGKPVAASDGYVYLGANAKDVKESTERRTVVYAVRDAVSCLAAIDYTATEFLEYALPHQLWKAKEAQEIERALEWLRDLHKVWEKRGKS